MLLSPQASESWVALLTLGYEEAVLAVLPHVCSLGPQSQQGTLNSVEVVLNICMSTHRLLSCGGNTLNMLGLGVYSQQKLLVVMLRIVVSSGN